MAMMRGAMARKLRMRPPSYRRRWLMLRDDYGVLAIWHSGRRRTGSGGLSNAPAGGRGWWISVGMEA
uniref:Uncharacterized protein n=1 Tax=Oryza meridionalis TaxID=40149 RepID=A0A0E0DKP2_9ORYZ